MSSNKYSDKDTEFEIISGNKYGDKGIEFEIIEEGKKVIKEGYLPIHADFMTGKLNIVPKVWLTLDEATEIFNALNHALDKAESVDDMLFYSKRAHLLKDKIKQVVKGHEAE